MTPTASNITPAAVRSTVSQPASPLGRMGLRDLFRLFLRLGFVFGGGTGMSAVLQQEVADRRQDVSRAEFMAMYGLARIVPSGSMTALAVAFGYRYRRLPGTIVALGAMILPGFLITVLLTIGRELIVGSKAFDMLNLSLMPAALAVVIVATWKLVEEFFSPSVELALALAACVGVAVFGLNPPILLVLGGLIGAVAIRDRNPKGEQPRP